MSKNEIPVIYEEVTKNKNNFFTTSLYHLPQRKLSFLHYHDVVEIGVCLGGQGEYITTGEKRPYSAGDVQFIPPYSPHYDIATDNNTLWMFVNIDVPRISSPHLTPDPAYFIELSQKINVSGVFTKDDHPRINRYITDIAALAQSDSTDHEASLDLIAAKIAILLIELAEIDSKSSSDTSGIKKNRGVLPAMQYVSESLQRDQHPTPGGMAEACFMSDSYFRKTFTSVMGESPKNYITRMQALKAARLLSETTAPIYDIASACGFEDNSTFYRSFMRIYGVSPSDYRNHTSSKNEPIN